MLFDVRKLIFSDDLLQEAVLEHCRREGVEIPNTQIQTFRFIGKSGKGSKVVVEFVTADPKRPFELTLNEQFVLTAMILACKANHVPLPRDATKTIQMTDKGLAMAISLRIDTPPTKSLRNALQQAVS